MPRFEQDSVRVRHPLRWLFAGVLGAGLVAATFDTETPVVARDEASALADPTYNIYAQPAHHRPTVVAELGKIDNPIMPVCYVESATIAVNSILTQAYLKGAGRPIVGFVADYEFPEIYGWNLPDCSEADLATVNVDTMLHD